MISEDDAVAFSSRLPQRHINELGWHSTRHPSVQTPRGVLWAGMDAPIVRSRAPLRRSWYGLALMAVIAVAGAVVAFWGSR